MQDPLHEIANLVLSLPEPWRGYLIALITLSTSVAALLAIVKRWWTPDPNPAPWKRWLYRALDAIATNSTPLLKQVELAQKERELEVKDAQIAGRDAIIKSLAPPAMSVSAGPFNDPED